MNRTELEFWNEYKRWYLADINKCYNCDANFATVTTILTSIDALGGFYKGLVLKELTEERRCERCNNINNIKNKKWLVPVGGKRLKPAKKIYAIDGVKYEESGNRDVFVSFIKNYMHEFYGNVSENINKKAVEILYSHFRNGFIHEGGPKFGTGIYREDSEELYKPYPESGIIMAINVTSFKKYFEIAFDNYEKALFDKKKPERLCRWRTRYKYMKSIHN